MYLRVSMFLTINNQNLYGIRRTIFLTDTQCVLYEVRAEVLHKNQTIFSCRTVNTNTV